MYGQCKGKDISKLPSRFIPAPDDMVLHSIKRDGHYVQAIVNAMSAIPTVEFYTSGGKQFYVQDWAVDLMATFFGKVVLIEAEYTGQTDGLVGDRRHCGKLTTYRANFTKELPSMGVNGDKLWVFTVIDLNKQLDTTTNSEIAETINNTDWNGCRFFRPVNWKETDYENAVRYAENYIKRGYEGTMVIVPDELYLVGRRVNSRIKLKLSGKITLTVKGVTMGTGKYTGLIGALVLDTDGTVNSSEVNVGSGLTDEQRKLPADYWLGKQVEIEYFNIHHDNYQQPRLKKVL